MRQTGHYLLLGLICLALTNQSCVSHQELISLNASQMTLESGSGMTLDSFQIRDHKTYLIQPLDMLLINVNTLEENTKEFLQQQFSSSRLSTQDRSFRPEAIYYNSYEVDAEGFIFLPIIDSIKVSGLTVQQVRKQLDLAFSPYLKYASSSIKLANMRVTVLGEVENPGVQYIYNTQTSILEVISMAGDFSDFANRKKVRLIRKTPKGAKTTMINLHKTDFVEGPYFHVQPNDVLYVEPIKAKAFDVGSRSVSLVLSVISTAALLANIFLNTRRD